MSTPLVVDLTADEANAVVYALSGAIKREAEHFAHLDQPTCPGDWFRHAASGRRIGRLAAITDQLQWLVHWGPIGGEPPAIIATRADLLDVAKELHQSAEDQERPFCHDEVDGHFAFDEAARTIARAFAKAEAVPHEPRHAAPAPGESPRAAPIRSADDATRVRASARRRHGNDRTLGRPHVVDPRSAQG